MPLYYSLIRQKPLGGLFSGVILLIVIQAGLDSLNNHWCRCFIDIICCSKNHRSCGLPRNPLRFFPLNFQPYLAVDFRCISSTVAQLLLYSRCVASLVRLSVNDEFLLRKRFRLLLLPMMSFYGENRNIFWANICLEEVPRTLIPVEISKNASLRIDMSRGRSPD